MSKGNETQMAALKRSLRRIAEAQAEFWDAMSEFEKLSGVELSSFNSDFTEFVDPTDEEVAWVMKNYVEGSPARG